MNMKPSPWIVFRYYWAADGHNETKTISCASISWMPISKGTFALCLITGETKMPQMAVSFGPRIIIFDISYNQDAIESDLQSKISIGICKEWSIDENIVYMEWITGNVRLDLFYD